MAASKRPRARHPAASSGRLYLVLDLETVTDPELRDLEKDRDGKVRFPPPPAHEIVCVGYAWLEDLRVLSWGVLDEGEDISLRKLALSIEKADQCLVTCNGRHFDMPVVVARCLRRGVTFPWYYRTKNPRYRYSADSHLDLMDQLCDMGAGNKASLDAWARLIGWPGKENTDGRDVPTLLASGGVGAVADYCMRDVAQTCALLLRFELLCGRADLASYQAAAAALLETCESDARTAALAFSVDRARWLLDETDSDREAAE